MVDADPAGAGVAAGYLRGAVPDGVSLVSLAIRGILVGGMAGAARQPLLHTAALDETGRRGVLLGINDPAQAASVAAVLPDAVDTLSAAGDVLVDLGRVTQITEATGVVVDRADQVLVVCRPSLVSVSADPSPRGAPPVPGRPAPRRRVGQPGGGRAGTALPDQRGRCGSGRTRRRGAAVGRRRGARVLRRRRTALAVHPVTPAAHGTGHRQRPAPPVTTYRATAPERRNSRRRRAPDCGGGPWLTSRSRSAADRPAPRTQARRPVNRWSTTPLVREVRTAVAARLATELQNRAPLDPAARRELGRHLLATELADRARARVTSGQPAWPAAQELAVANAVMAALFGLGRLQPLVDDPRIENIEINGCDQVWVSYADGREAPAGPVADSDDRADRAAPAARGPQHRQRTVVHHGVADAARAAGRRVAAGGGGVDDAAPAGGDPSAPGPRRRPGRPDRVWAPSTRAWPRSCGRRCGRARTSSSPGCRTPGRPP